MRGRARPAETVAAAAVAAAAVAVAAVAGVGRPRSWMLPPLTWKLPVARRPPLVLLGPCVARSPPPRAPSSCAARVPPPHHPAPRRPCHRLSTGFPCTRSPGGRTRAGPPPPPRGRPSPLVQRWRRWPCRRRGWSATRGTRGSGACARWVHTWVLGEAEVGTRRDGGVVGERRWEGRVAEVAERRRCCHQVKWRRQQR